MSIPLQSGVVYGPILSRRFGRSLGINLSPSDHKICNFRCAYCQYGIGPGDGQEPPSLEMIVDACRAAFREARAEWDSRPDWIMISGNGEPTLHPRFAEATEAMARLRDELIPDVPMGILSNSSTCWQPAVRYALLKLDGRFMKLDAGSSRVFEAINGPISEDGWKRMVRGLADLRGITLQSLFVAGRVDNATEEAVREWTDAVAHIAPESVQVYTLDRPAAIEGLEAVPAAVLESIAARLYARTHAVVRVFWPRHELSRAGD